MPPFDASTTQGLPELIDDKPEPTVVVDDKLRKRLLRLVQKNYGAGSEAEDAVQETLLAI